jgi:hypothetical protein
MKDREKWMEGEVKSTETNKPDVFITREMPKYIAEESNNL